MSAGYACDFRTKFNNVEQLVEQRQLPGGLTTVLCNKGSLLNWGQVKKIIAETFADVEDGSRRYGLQYASELTKLITDEIFKKLVENCFSVLIGNQEIHTLTAVADSKLDVIKEFYAVLLSISANFVRNDTIKDEIQQRLSKSYNWSINRINLYLEEFQKHKIGIQTSLVNIGTHFPSVVDVKWKIDYIIQSSIVSETDGPIFRICLVTEKYDIGECGKKLQYINFTCNSQEMQDLIYKLKDAVRHCQSVANRIS